MTTVGLFLIASLMVLGILLSPWAFRRRRNLTLLSEELSAAVRMNIPLPRILEAFSSDTRGNEAEAARLLAARLEEGELLSEAALEAPSIFPGAAPQLISAGEKSGKVGQALHQASLWAWNDYKERWSLVLILWYPFLLGAFYAFIGGLFTILIIPRFMDIAESIREICGESRLEFHGLWALETRVVFGWIPLGLAILYVGWTLASFRPAPRRIQRWIVCRIPLISRLEKLKAMERLCRVLSFLIGSGCSVPECLRIGADSGLNPIDEKRVREAVDHAREGVNLEEALRQTSRFPRDFLWKLGLAVRSRDTENALTDLADHTAARARALRGRLHRASAVFAVFFVAVHGAIWEWLFFHSLNVIREVFLGC